MIIAMRIDEARDWRFNASQVWEQYTRLPDRFGIEYDAIFSKLVRADQIESWEHYLQWSADLRGWGFRGQSDAGWSLQTSLERAIRVEYCYEGNSGHHYLDRRDVSGQLLNRFQEEASRRIPYTLPSDDDLASWFALMQHYGIPTRMLDWTDSPTVALYFAIREHSNMQRKSGFAAVWAIDLAWLEARGSEVLTSSESSPIPADNTNRISFLNSILSQRERPIVVRVDPLLGNPRMAAQKGFFLWKLFELTPWFDQILTTMIVHPRIPERPVVRKAVIPVSLCDALFGRLAGIGIDAASLFPSEGSHSAVLGALAAEVKSYLQRLVDGERTKQIEGIKEWLRRRAING